VLKTLLLCFRELVFIVFFRNIVLGKLVRVHFVLVGIVRFLNASHRSSLEQVSFLHQFIDTFRVCLLSP